MKTIEQLRKEGYAIVIYSPEELRGANPKAVQDAIVEQSWVIIDELATEDESND